MNLQRTFSHLGLLPLLVGQVLAHAACADGWFRFEENSAEGEPPAKFVYDPQSGNSLPNHRAHRAADQPVAISTKLNSHPSFTIEAFAKPDADLQTRPRDMLPVWKTGGDDVFLIAGIRRSPPPHSYNWWLARVISEGNRPVDLAKNRYRGISMVSGETPWRHLACTWNSEAKTLAYYLDYRLQATATLEQQPDWDITQLLIGGSGAGKPFSGLIDEVRVTETALPPWLFLRATEVELRDVRFAPEDEPTLPADYGHADVRLHYGAVGDGRHDDTAAIRRAFAENQNRVPNEYRTVYFPAGTYLISDTIQFSRFMVVRGAGRDKTMIKLKDRADGFATPGAPKPAFAVGYEWPYVDRPKKNRAGNVIGNYIFDLSINTGTANPSALGLDFHCNNHGCVENVDIVSGDGGGMVGLDFRRAWPGPCLMKNVSISGFDVGIAAAHREYSLVFSGVELRNQRVAAISNTGNVLSMENVVSDNRVPAVQNRGGGLVVLINSRLGGGKSENTAISSDNSSLYLRSVSIDGYGQSVAETRTPKQAASESRRSLSDKQIDEYFTGPFDYAYETREAGSLKLPVKQTPEILFPPVDQWVNVRHFEHLVRDGDWSSAIQAAVDSGKPLVYFPDGPRYAISKDVVLRGSIRTFLGGSPKTKIASGSAGQSDQPERGCALILDETLPAFQFHMLATSHIRHESGTTLLLRHCNSEHISAGPGCGDLFIENAGGMLRVNEHQRVWGRQLNPESRDRPEIVNNGGQLWTLGLKTEYLSTKIDNRDGAKTEILGGLMYPVHPVTDESLPMFRNEGSDISLVHGVSVYKKNHKIYMQDIRSGETRNFTQWHWIGGRPITNLYRSSRP